MDDRSFDNPNNDTKPNPDPSFNENNNNNNHSDCSAEGDDNGVIPSTQMHSATDQDQSPLPPSQPSSTPPPQPSSRHLRSRPPQPHELTAEWTVRAQLRFARAGERVEKEFSQNDAVNPVRVVYKWTTLDPNGNEKAHEGGRSEKHNHSNDGDDDNDVDDDDNYNGGDEVYFPGGDGVDDNDDVTSCNTSFSNKKGSSFRHSATPFKFHHKQCRQRQSSATELRHESFCSTTSSTVGDLGGGDSAFSSSNTSNKKSQENATQGKDKTRTAGDTFARISPGGGVTAYGTRCHSTCSIVVSAVADFLPMDTAIASPNAAEGEAAPDVDNFMTKSAKGMKRAGTTRETTINEKLTDEEAFDSFLYQETVPLYKTLPKKLNDDAENIATTNFTSVDKILALRDAFSQTSDTETKNLIENKSSHRKNLDDSTNKLNAAAKDTQLKDADIANEQQYHPSEFNSEVSMDKPICEGAKPLATAGNPFVPFFPRIPKVASRQDNSTVEALAPSTQNHDLPKQQLQQGQLHKSLSSNAEPQKKPRTVHIDVYCTGSDEDDDDHADVESSSSPDEPDVDGGARYDQDSNSTPQTVLDNEQMLLRHQRVTGSVLPRRLVQQTKPKRTQIQRHKLPSSPSQVKTLSSISSPTELNVGHAITKSSTAEEVSESKQLLFRKHIGDQCAIKLQNLRQKYIRQHSDDVLSPIYPNSSRSTMRDNTCSSISSIVPSSPADLADSAWKEIYEVDDNRSRSLTKSDSFEYENIVDRIRIKEMERFWSTHGLGSSSSEEVLQNSPPRHFYPPTVLQTITEGNFLQQLPPKEQLCPQPEEHSDINDFYHQEPNAPANERQQQSLHLQQTPHFMRNKPGFLQFFGPPTPPPTAPVGGTNFTKRNEPLSAPLLPTEPHLLFPEYGQNLHRWKSDSHHNLSDTAPSPVGFSSLRSSPQFGMGGHLSPTPLSAISLERCSSEVPSTSSNKTSTLQTAPTQGNKEVRRFDLKFYQHPQQENEFVRETASVLAGYSSEYFEKARKFGRLVSVIRKPGHHIGPVKNPNCSCDSCQRWLADRDQLRERSFSLGEYPVLKKSN